MKRPIYGKKVTVTFCVTFAGTITSGSFNTTTPFPGDLRDKYFAAGGGAGTYTRSGNTWTKS